MIKFTEEQITENYAKFLQIIEDTFSEERASKILAMYDHIGERLYTAPASSYEQFHLPVVGGYIQHVLNIIELSEKVQELFKATGGVIDFTDEERIFAAMHHDLGKLGDEDSEYYQIETSEWHRKNQGRLYKTNTNMKNMAIHDRTFFLLQKFGIEYSINEFFGIRLADGLFESDNDYYYKTFNADKKFKNNIQYVIHWADWMTSVVEYDQWKLAGKEQVKDIKQKFAGNVENKDTKSKAALNAANVFKDMFGDK